VSVCLIEKYSWGGGGGFWGVFIRGAPGRVNFFLFLFFRPLFFLEKNCGGGGGGALRRLSSTDAREAYMSFAAFSSGHFCM